MCLLNLLEQKTNKLVVCHINHNVRKESTTEEEYLKDYCQKHNLIFESMKITEYKKKQTSKMKPEKKDITSMKKYYPNIILLNYSLPTMAMIK